MTIESLKRYTAYIYEFDKDYRTFTGLDEKIDVDSKKEADDYARKQSGSGFSYHVHMLYDNFEKKWVD